MTRAVDLPADTEDQILDALSRLLASGTSALGPHIRSCPADAYRDEDRHARERRLFFRRYPLIVGYAAELSAENDFITRDVADIPILLTRDAGGSIHAFLNVCRHRGNRVCVTEKGRSPVFACGYHGWAYANDGKCLTFGAQAAFDGLRHEDYGLRALPVEVRHGLIWLVPWPGATLNVRQYLGAKLDDELAAFSPHAGVVAAQRTDCLRFNWKLGVETFLEISHIATLHKASIATHFLDGLMIFEELGLHSRIAAARRSFAGVVKSPRSTWRLSDHAVMIYLLFPNSVLLFQRDHIQLYSFEAGERPGTCIVRAALLTESSPLAARAAKHWEENWDIVERAVYREDFQTMERIQQAISSGAVDSFVFGRNEAVLQHFHDGLDRRLETARAEVPGHRHAGEKMYSSCASDGE